MTPPHQKMVLSGHENVRLFRNRARRRQFIVLNIKRLIAGNPWCPDRMIRSLRRMVPREPDGDESPGLQAGEMEA